MQNYFIPLVKIIVLSTLITLIIKYGSPQIPLSSSLINVMIGVFSPTLILGIILLLRWQNYSSSSSNSLSEKTR
ncbi:MAG: hypothetical protein AB4058_09090 [Microcystaceae cyanobacterium]